MKMTNGFNSSLKIVAPYPIRLWGHKTWLKEKEWFTGPCQYADSRIFEYNAESRELSSYTILNGEKGELRRRWTLPVGTVVSSVLERLYCES